jgi:phosphatidylglycerophosphate synthase
MSATATPSRPASAHPSAPVTTTPTAVLLATAPAEEGGPAALLPWEGGTVLGRLLDQLASLGVRTAHVVTRPAWAAAVREAGADAEVAVAEDLAADLRLVAALAADAPPGGIVLLAADVVTHREALAGLLADPRVATGVLAGGRRHGYPYAAPTRSLRGRILSAGSPFHSVRRPTGRFLSVLKVTATDRPRLTEAAERVATLTAAGLPEGWDDELGRKEAGWRGRLARAAARQEDLEASEAAGDDEPNEFAELTELDTDDDGEPEADPTAALGPEDEARLSARVAGARADALSLVVVALVRSGAHVGNSHLRRLFWARPASHAEIARASEQILDYDEDRVLLDSAVKATDGFFTTFFVSPYSKHIARWTARRGFTPNQVTIVSMALAVLAAAAFATGERWGLVAGAILLQVAFTTDCVDGQLARYTRTFTKLGGWLDATFDRSKEFIVMGGLAIGSQEDVWVLACAALTLQVVRHMADFSFAESRIETIGSTRHPPLEQPWDTATRAAASAAATPAPVPSVAPSQRVLQFWRRLDRMPAATWLKRIVAFPIGERFFVVSLTAALWDAEVTFVALLACGTFAALYQLAGRLLRSVSR